MLRALFILAGMSAAAIAADVPEVTHLTDDEGGRKPARTVVPVYPKLARRERLEGEVQVCFNIRRDGTIHRARVRKSTNRIFEKPALRAVRASTYAALPEGKKPRGIKTCRTFLFRLDRVSASPPARE